MSMSFRYKVDFCELNESALWLIMMANYVPRIKKITIIIYMFMSLTMAVAYDINKAVAYDINKAALGTYPRRVNTNDMQTMCVCHFNTNINCNNNFTPHLITCNQLCFIKRSH